MKDVYRSLIKNKNETRVIALVADQTPAGGEIQYFTKFLNQKTPFFVGADKIARHTDSPVVYLETKRIRRGYYEAHFHKLQEPPYEEKNFTIVEQYARVLEKSILESPADWLWSHKRWKHQEMKHKRNLGGGE
jgi:KDO2-lipid IV(A) lauroyltransferase